MSAPRLHRLSNGVTVICDPAPGYETLALSVVAGRGSRWEDAPRSGWSHLLEHMVFKGAGGRSARDIVEVIEAAGGQINAATGHERTSFQVRALAGGLPLAMAVTADIVQRPTLDAEDLAREKHVVGQEIAEAADAPDDLVFELARVAAGEIAGMLTPVGEAELARAKAQLKGAMFMGREGALARAEQAAGQVLLFGRTLDPAEIAAQVDAVTPADLVTLTGRILAPKKAAVAVLGPKASLKAAPAFEAALFG